MLLCQCQGSRAKQSGNPWSNPLQLSSLCLLFKQHECCTEKWQMCGSDTNYTCVTLEQLLVVLCLMTILIATASRKLQICQAFYRCFAFFLQSMLKEKNESFSFYIFKKNHFTCFVKEWKTHFFHLDQAISCRNVRKNYCKRLVMLSSYDLRERLSTDTGWTQRLVSCVGISAASHFYLKKNQNTLNQQNGQRTQEEGKTWAGRDLFGTSTE